MRRCGLDEFLQVVVFKGCFTQLNFLCALKTIVHVYLSTPTSVVVVWIRCFKVGIIFYFPPTSDSELYQNILCFNNQTYSFSLKIYELRVSYYCEV